MLSIPDTLTLVAYALRQAVGALARCCHRLTFASPQPVRSRDLRVPPTQHNQLGLAPVLSRANRALRNKRPGSLVRIEKVRGSNPLSSTPFEQLRRLAAGRIGEPGRTGIGSGPRAAQRMHASRESHHLSVGAGAGSCSRPAQRGRRDQCGGEFWDSVGEFVFGVVSDAVSVAEAQPRVDVQFDVRMQAMPDPSHPHTANRAHPGLRRQRLFSGVDQVGVDSVKEATEYVADCGAQDCQDRHGDDQADDRIGQREAERDTARENSTASEVNPSVRACNPSATSAADPMRVQSLCGRGRPIRFR